MKYYLRAANTPQAGNYISAFTAADNNFTVTYSNEKDAALELDEPSANAIRSFLDKHKKYFDLVPYKELTDRIITTMRAELIRIKQMTEQNNELSDELSDIERIKRINSFATKALLKCGMILDERA